MVSMDSKNKQITLKIQSSKPKNPGRSENWPMIRKHHLQNQPECQACGSKQRLEVHHIVPVHVDKTKELDPLNLITLCENPATGFCHYIFGHLSLSWWKYDPYVILNTHDHREAIKMAQEQQDYKGKPVT